MRKILITLALTLALLLTVSVVPFAQTVSASSNATVRMDVFWDLDYNRYKNGNDFWSDTGNLEVCKQGVPSSCVNYQYTNHTKTITLPKYTTYEITASAGTTPLYTHTVYIGWFNNVWLNISIPWNV